MPFDLKESNQFGITNMLVKGCIIQPNFVLVVLLQGIGFIPALT